jgi:hypothetical protein
MSLKLGRTDYCMIGYYTKWSSSKFQQPAVECYTYPNIYDNMFAINKIR